MEEYKKPLPLIDDEDMKPFWEAAKLHELLARRCECCGTFYPPVVSCPNCTGAETKWGKVSGKAKLFTYVVMHQLYHPGFKDDIPYNVSVVELDEGPLLVSNVVECKNEDLKIGMPLEVVFDDVTTEVTIPRFKPAG